MELVQLNGTIPVRFKGAVYNIPVCIWLMDTHPNNAPICYVRPTADMSIKVSMFVDQNGKIYLPYLHDWKPVCILFFVVQRHVGWVNSLHWYYRTIVIDSIYSFYRK